MVERVIATQRARALIERLRQERGPLLLRHGGDCRDGATADVIASGAFEAGTSDLLLGEVAGCPLYVGRAQAGHWRYAQLIVDVDAEEEEGEEEEGEGAPALRRPDMGAVPAKLQTRSRRFSTEEWAALAQACSADEAAE